MSNLYPYIKSKNIRNAPGLKVLLVLYCICESPFAITLLMVSQSLVTPK